MEIRKKIIVTVSNDLNGDQRMQRICSELSLLGFDVELIGRLLPTSLPLKQSAYRQRRLTLFLKKGPLFYLELNCRLAWYLWFHKSDIIYSVDADTSFAAFFVQRLRKINWVFDAHELFSEVPELQGHFIKKRIWKFVEKKTILNADHLITVSDSLANYWQTLYQKPFTVIKNVPIQRNGTPTNSAKPYVLYQGALNKGRGLETLIQAAAHIGIEVKIAGAGDLSEDLRSMAGPGVTFLGKLEPEALREVTESAWLGYNLLDNSSLSYYYSLSNKTFDYMHAGIPQLLPDFPEYIQLMEKYEIGLLCGLEEVQIIEKIKNLRENSEMYNRLKNKCIEASKVFNWQNESQKLKAIFQL